MIITIVSQNFTKVTDDKTTQMLEGFPELLENFRRSTVTAQEEKSGINTSPRNTLTKPSQALKPCLPNVEM